MLFVQQKMWFNAVVISALATVSGCHKDLVFPPGFKFGAATSSYQVEGAWNSSDKSESIWDRFIHAIPERIIDFSNGDVACDCYHLWKREVEIASELGLNFYRFSISWSRLLPNAFSNYISEDGKEYYNNLIDGLLEKGIEPVVTLYHWDLPQILQDLGGWTNPLIVDWFGDYAVVAYTLFGDRVKTWLTINEPIVVCDLAYNSGNVAPGILDPELGAYICNKNVLMAHAKAWRIYDEKFRERYHGVVSLSNQLIWFDPANPTNDEDIELAALALENCAGRYSHAIYSKEGGWPPAIEKLMAENSKRRGYPKSCLPNFTPEEIEFVKGTYDFYAMNHYTSRLVRKAKDDEEPRSWPLGDAPDLNAMLLLDPNLQRGASTWFVINPEGIRRQLVWLKKHYGDLQIFISENGLSTGSGLNDQDRIKFYEDYLRQVLLAIKEDGVNVTHYTAWSLLDNFEWKEGYAVKFGLYEVDFTHPERKRTPRASALYYARLIKTHSLIDPKCSEELSTLPKGIQ